MNTSLVEMEFHNKVKAECARTLSLANLPEAVNRCMDYVEYVARQFAYRQDYPKTAGVAEYARRFIDVNLALNPVSIVARVAELAAKKKIHFKTEYTGVFIDNPPAVSGRVWGKGLASAIAMQAEQEFRNSAIFGTTDVPESLRGKANYFGGDILSIQRDISDCLNKIRESHGAMPMAGDKYAESVVARAADIARRNAMVADSLNAPKARCEWLARELGLAPDASEDLLRAEVHARLADQWEAYHRRVDECEVMRHDLLAANARVESVLDELHNMECTNKDLRAIVAEQELRLRKRK